MRGGLRVEEAGESGCGDINGNDNTQPLLVIATMII